MVKPPSVLKINQRGWNRGIFYKSTCIIDTAGKIDKDILIEKLSNMLFITSEVNKYLETLK